MLQFTSPLYILSHVNCRCLFSLAGKVFSAGCCRLADDTFQKLMFIPCNNNCISEVPDTRYSTD